MNYTQTIDYLFSSLPTFQQIGADAYKPGLERIAEFCRHLGNPQRNFFTIHVAGTNGKGSVSHILASVLQQAGYQVGLYTSPHLKDFRERIRVNGEMIPKQRVVNFVDKNQAKMEELDLSFFEMTTAMAFDYFAHSDVEVAVIETGLGGRLDATNVIVPLVSVITNIGKEHTELLGSTIAEIAREKAGIIKKSIPVVVGERCEEYNAVIETVAAEMKSQVIYAQDWFECKRCEDCDSMQHLLVTRMDDKKVFDVKLDLMGCYQPANVVTATAVVNYLHESSPLTISSRAFIEGLESVIESTHLAGRWQVLGEQPLMVCDTGHNSAGLKYVGEELSRMAKEYKRQICVMGVSGDKDVEAMLEQMPREAYYIFTQASIRRAMPAEELLAKAKAAGFEGEAVASVAEAVEKAKQMAQAEDMIFVGGSNFVVAEIL